MKNILIIEEDLSLAKGIIIALKNIDFNFIHSSDLSSARTYIKTIDFNLIILDINLPDGNGLYFLKELRRNSSVPVIILTANDLETDIVTGLELGADDYITKPFSLMILRARVNARLRNAMNKPVDPILINNFSFSFSKMEFYKNNIPIELSKTEQKLLHILIKNRGHILTRSQLVDNIWTDGAEYVNENALSVTVKRLRDKLEENPSVPVYIKTIYGIGYSWAVI